MRKRGEEPHALLIKLAVPDWERLSAEGRSKRLNIGARGYLLAAWHLLTSFLGFRQSVNFKAQFVNVLTLFLAIEGSCPPFGGGGFQFHSSSFELAAMLTE